MYNVFNFINSLLYILQDHNSVSEYLDMYKISFFTN